MSVVNVLPPAVTELQNTLTYQFSQSRYLLEALRMAGTGFGNLGGQNSLDGNKRLAQLGDAILRTMVLEDWYTNGADREMASEQISTISSASYLSQFAYRINLHGCILVNPSLGQEAPSWNVVAKSVQALVGALWLDSDRNIPEVRRILQATRFWDINLTTS